MAHSDFDQNKITQIKKGDPLPDGITDVRTEEPKYYEEDINEVLDAASANKLTKVDVIFDNKIMKALVAADGDGKAIEKDGLKMALPCPPYYQEQKNEAAAGKYLA